MYSTYIRFRGAEGVSSAHLLLTEGHTYVVHSLIHSLLIT